MKNTIAFIIILLLVSCEKTDINSQSSNYDYIKYGTSFGECIGYCIRTIEVTDSNINLSKKGWNMEGKLLDQNMSETIDFTYWNSLIETLDFDAFLKLDSIIGCPDCADGGAEWIEIKKKDKTYKVTFEYWNQPKTVSDLVGYLRTYMISANIESAKPATFSERTLINQQGTIKNFLCSRGCNQYLIECIQNEKKVYYFDQNLNTDFQTDGLLIQFNGVLQNDSTTINKPAPNDVPTPDFEARNISVIDMKIVSD